MAHGKETKVMLGIIFGCTLQFSFIEMKAFFIYIMFLVIPRCSLKSLWLKSVNLQISKTFYHKIYLKIEQ